MDETDPQHPGRDQELAERYALGRLPPRERTLFDAHLRECNECRGLVDLELRIAAGVRRAGREDFVGRLRTQLGQAPAYERASERARRISWPRIVGVAASLLILAGFGIVRFWLLPEGNENRIPEISQRPPTESADGAAAQPPPSVGSARDGKGERPPPDEAKSAPLTSGVPLKSGAPLRSNAPLEPGGESKWAARDHENEAESVPTQAARPAIAEQRLDDAVREKDKSDAGILVEGTIVEPTAAGGPAGLKKEQKENFQLSQHAANAVRPAVRQRQEGQRNILTRMENVNNQLQLTFYPETLFTEEMFRNARIEPIGKDSLRVTIGNQMILYRIPQQLQQSAPAR